MAEYELRSPSYYYSDGLDFKNFGFCKACLSMRLISNIITMRIISDDF